MMRYAKTYLSFATVTLVSLGLSGCINQTQEVDHYRAVLHARPQPLPRKVPHLLTLAGALRMANDNNESLAIAGENYLQAIIAKDRAFANFFPTVSLAPTDYQRHGFNETQFPPGFGNLFQTHYFDVPLAATLNVNILRDSTAVSAAGSFTGVQKSLLLNMQSDLLLETAQTYYAILSAQRSVQVLRRTLQVEKATVASEQRKMRAGIALRLTVLQDQADAARTRVQLTNAENQVQHGRATLAYLIGVNSLYHARLVNLFRPPQHVPALAALDRVALADRQDLKADQDSVVVAEKGVSEALAEYFPSVSINFDTFLYKESFPSDSWWNGLFTVNLPIFEGGMIYNDVRTAYSKLRQAMLEEQMLRRRIHEQVRIALSNWLTSQQLVRDTRTETKAARAAFLQARHSFQVGLATNLDVITAEDRYLAANLAYQQAKYNTCVDMLNLLRESGRLTYASIAQLSHQQAARLAMNSHAGGRKQPAATSR